LAYVYVDYYLLSVPTSPRSRPGPPTWTLCAPPVFNCPTVYWKGLPVRNEHTKHELGIVYVNKHIHFWIIKQTHKRFFTKSKKTQVN